MGFMSRRVLPVCGNLCFFCPSMRARSRQPVKRYKKLLADIFSRSQIIGSFNEDEAFKDIVGDHSGRKTSVTVNTLDILSANHLIDSVLETARQVASFHISTIPVPYDQMKSQCEALVMGKQQKMSALLSMKQQNETVIHENGLTSSSRIRIQLLEQSKMVEAEHIRVGGRLRCSAEYEKSFRLPPSSPYDKFLKAAGW